MSQRTGRNDLCPCGSGKKMKACHPDGVARVSKNRNLLLIGLGVAAVVVVAAAMMREDTSAPPRANPSRPMTPPTQNATNPISQGAGTPQPGPAPPGKVWSPEHGHWHDQPGATPPSAGQSQQVKLPAPQKPGVAGPNQPAAANTPQPPGIAPEGKVWSPEHGHYHDPPKTAPATPAQGSGPN